MTYSKHELEHCVKPIVMIQPEVQMEMKDTLLEDLENFRIQDARIAEQYSQPKKNQQESIAPGETSNPSSEEEEDRDHWMEAQISPLA